VLSKRMRQRFPDCVSLVAYSGLIDGEPHRPSSRLPGRVQEIGDDILGFAIRTPAAEGYENDPVSVEDRPVPTSVFADECAAAVFMR
jgi:hypothetical protein